VAPSIPNVPNGDAAHRESDSGLHLSGSVERVTFHNPENGFAIVRLRPDAPARRRDADEEALVVVGVFAEAPDVGSMWKLTGTWVDDPKWGRQFKIATAHPFTPTTLDGLERYIGSGVVKGLGPKTAKRIVEHFGDELIPVLESEPQRLAEVRGLSRIIAQELRSFWSDKKRNREAALFLSGLGLTPRMIARIIEKYGAGAEDAIRRNPYRLAQDIERIGFRRADAIARTLKMPLDAPERIEAGVLHLLSQAADDGHCYYPFEALCTKAAELLGCDESVAKHGVASLYRDGFVRCEIVKDAVGESHNAVYTKHLWDLEDEAATRLAAQVAAPKLFNGRAALDKIDAVQAKWNLALAPEQRAAVEMALTTGVGVITGGPGTGKTTIVRMILALMASRGAKVLLCAPTGRAAKRLSEASQHQAMTLHRLLAFDPSTGRFLFGPDQPLKADLVLVDEASMLDLALSVALLRAMPPTAGLLLVGDVDQLPSVGAGDFLRDVIESKTVAVARLHEIFRQARSSLIVTNAHRINQGEFPYLGDPKPGAESSEEPKRKRRPDFFFVEKDGPGEVIDAVVRLVRERIPQKFGFDAVDDVQVLTPMNKNSLGTVVFNAALQETLNSHNPPALERTGQVWRVGDKVMQTKNNYDLDVYNGDIGRIVGSDGVKKTLTVEFDGKLKPYSYEETEQLTLAYAISVHKSQGGEYPAVVVVMHSSHFVMLQRNLLYTAITRAKKLAVIVGQRKALGAAIKNTSSRNRNTALAWRLRQSIDAESSGR